MANSYFYRLKKLFEQHLMNRISALTSIALFCSCLLVQAQEEILFTVEDQQIPLSEFVYIYEKTNRDKADYSEASVMEYLELYRKFKLKVQKARDMQLDTIVSLQQELAGYRKQLASTYLNDKEVLNRLVEEVHERMQEEVSFSHILFRIGVGASEQDEEAAYAKGLEVLEQLRDGGDFEQLAMRHSDDESVNDNKGNVGYMTAMMSDGFYALENTLYTLPTKTYSRPIRTKVGYHIVRVNARRAARGEIEVRQILIRTGKNKDAKSRIDEIHAELAGGADFEELAKNVSEDKKTAPNGGYLGSFGINTYESAFESTAFRLKNDGDFSEPVHTKIGWHIIQRVSHKPVPPLNELQRALEAKIKKDMRFKIAEESMVDRIRDENDYEKHDWDRERLLQEIGKDFRTYQWKAPSEFTNQDLFTIGGSTVQATDFLEFLTTNSADRLRLNRIEEPIEAIGTLYDKYEEEALLKYEESQLDEKYPDFKSLMREYSEGILLFEATKMKVWDKASQDTAGLEDFYRSHKQNYLWPERAVVETITINTTEPTMLKKIMAKLPTGKGVKLMKKFNKKRELIQISKATIDKDEMDPDLSWKAGSLSEQAVDKARDRVIIKRVDKILAPQPKTLDEARGYIIADYQDFLEKKWIEDLDKEYEVEVNDQVLNSIIK